MENGCLFPPEIWAQEPSENPRKIFNYIIAIITIIFHLFLFLFFKFTTNGSESFHRTYNAQFHSSHPSVHVVISILKEMQEETCTKIQSVLKVWIPWGTIT